jgi:hypothetical protein
MIRRLTLAAVLSASLLAPTLLTGCGGGSSSNGEEKKNPSQILADAKTAARDAGSVKVTGKITESGTTIGLDLRIGNDGGAGTMTIQGVKVDIVHIGNTVYVRAPASFYEKVGAGATAGQILDGKWLKASSSSKDFKDLAQLTDIGQFITEALKPEGAVTKGDVTTVDGQKVIELKDSKGGKLYVATTGKPYPIEFKGTGTSSGTLKLTDWGKSVKPKAPKSAIDLSKLGG